jgi:hypothetical protein
MAWPGIKSASALRPRSISTSGGSGTIPKAPDHPLVNADRNADHEQAGEDRRGQAGEHDQPVKRCQVAGQQAIPPESNFADDIVQCGFQRRLPPGFE